MRELSLNILDIAENSVKANASLIEISVVAKGGYLTITLKDDGCGMSDEFLARVTDPFTTTRTTRKVGLGLPFFKEAAEEAGGRFSIESQLGVGTIVCASFLLDHVDRMPLGDLADTMVTLLSGNTRIDYVLTYSVEDEFVFDTRDLKAELPGADLTEPTMLKLIREMISQNIMIANGGTIV